MIRTFTALVILLGVLGFTGCSDDSAPPKSDSGVTDAKVKIDMPLPPKFDVGPHPQPECGNE